MNANKVLLADMAGHVVQFELLGVDVPIFDLLPVHVNLERIDALSDGKARELHRLIQQVPVAETGQRFLLDDFEIAIEPQAKLRNRRHPANQPPHLCRHALFR